MITVNTAGNPISQRWKNAVKDPGQRLTKVDLYYNHQPRPTLENLEVISGSVTADMTSNTRRSGSITLANTDLLTSTPSLSLEPYGLELGIRWGVLYPDGTTEYVRVGMFPFETTEWAEGTGKIPTLTLQDRSFTVGERGPATGFADYSGQTAIAAIQSLVSKSAFNLKATQDFKANPDTASANDVYLVVDDATTAANFKLPGGSPMTDNFWADLSTVAAQLGAQIYFDVDGVNIILRPVDTLPKGQTSYDNVVEVGRYGALIDVDRTVSRDGVWNGVQVTGALPANAASTATPPYVFVYDSDPSSKTYYYGPFGRILHSETSDTLTTKAQLLGFANSLLAQGLGLAKASTISMLMDATFEPGDVVRVKYLDASTELHLIQSITFDLVTGVQQLTTIGQNQS